MNWCGEAFLKRPEFERTPLATNKDKKPTIKPYSWNEDWVVTPVEGYLVPGGVELHQVEGFKEAKGVSDGSVFLTKYFFEQSKISVPKNAVPHTLYTYRYYPLQHEKKDRGSGRDHLYAQELEPSESQVLSRKGSGTNSRYSAVNGSFDVKNFRKNGLLPLGEALLEYILAQNFKSAGIPIVENGKLTLFPKALQDPSFTQKDALRFAVQATRRDLHGRQSLRLNTPTLEQRLDFVSAFYFNNAAHGAINPENVTSQAEVLDLGHMTFSYPIISGTHRCTLCSGGTGALDHDDSRGVMDYYFSTKSLGNEKAFDYKIEESELSAFVSKLVKRVVHRSEAISLTSKEQTALHQAFQERLAIVGNADAFFSEVRDFGKRMTGKEFENYDPSSREVSFSLRFLMQVAALRLYLPVETYQKLALRTVLMGKNPGIQEHILTLLGLFERVFKTGEVTQASAMALFREYLPSNVMKEEIDAKLKGKSYEQVPTIVAGLIKALMKPMEMDPKTFATELWRLFERTNKGIDQKLVDAVSGKATDIAQAFKMIDVVQSAASGFENFNLPKDRLTGLSGLMKSDIGKTVYQKLSRKIKAGGFSSVAIGRGLALSLIASDPTLGATGFKLFLAGSPRNNASSIQRTYGEIVEFYKKSGSTGAFLNAAEFWMRSIDVEPKKKADVLLTLVGVDAAAFDRLLGAIPQTHLAAVWERIDDKSSLKVFLDLATKAGSRNFLLDHGAAESFLYISKPFPKSGDPKKFVMGEGSNTVNVTLNKPFEMAMTDVTQLQYALVTGKNPSKFVVDKMSVHVLEGNSWLGKKITAVEVDPNRPVEMVDWNDAKTYAERFSELSGQTYRLPTEAEFEFALRAGSQGDYSFGDSKLLPQYAWLDENSDNMTHPVARLKANAFGLHDIVGNVWKWTGDWYGDLAKNSVIDPVGPSTGSDRVVRGGGFWLNASNCRSAVRDGWPPGFRVSLVGFRLVRTPR